MNITPWELWIIETGLPNPKARTLRAREVLENALKNEASKSHPGKNIKMKNIK